MLQLEDVVGMIERFLNEPEAHRADARQHAPMLSLERLKESGAASAAPRRWH
jgi:hypothetical protein